MAKNLKSRAEINQFIDALAARFKLPADLLRTIVKIESDYRPHAENHTPNAERRGGAYGLTQITLETAQGLTKRYPMIAAELWANWNGSGKGLLDPAVNLSMAAFLLSRDYERYLARGFSKSDSWALAGLAHQQGAGGVEKIISANTIRADLLPPNGSDYYAKLVKYRDAGLV